MSEDATLEEFVDAEEDDTTESDTDTDTLDQEQFGPFTLSTPGEWSAKRLGDIKRLITRGKQPTYDDDGIPVINQECIYWDGWHFENLRYLDEDVGKDWKDKYFPQRGDVILNSTGKGTLGRAQVYPDNKRRAIDSHVTLLRTEDELSPYFHRYFLESHLGQALLYSMCVNGSTGQIELSKTRLDLQPIPLPPLPEQRKIATVLNTVDRAIEKNEEIREQTKQSKKAVAQDLIHTGIEDQDTRNAWMGEIPIHWDVRDFSEIIELSRNGIYKDQDSYGGPYPIIKMGDIFGGVVLEEPIAESVHLDDDELEKYEAIEGDLVFARHAQAGWGAGDCTYVPDIDGRAVVESNMVQVRLNDEMEPLFYAQYFNSEIGVKSIKRITTTGNIKSISQDDLMKLKVPVPPKQEQIEIAKTLSSFDDQVDYSESEAERLRRLKRGLMQDLLSGTVRTTDTNIAVPEKIAQHG